MSCCCQPETPRPVVRWDIQIPAGATWTRTLTWKTGTPAAPVDLTGYTARMRLLSIGREPLDLTTDNGRITLGGADGTITLSIDAATTATLAPVTYQYDLELQIADYVKRLAGGHATVSANITP